MATTPIKILPAPGIRRDGTNLETKEWKNGQHVRFQRGRPRKMRGIRSLATTLTDESRQLISQTLTGLSYIHSGNKNGIDEVSVMQNGSALSVVNRTPSPFTVNTTNTWQFATIYDPGTALQQLIAVSTTSLLDPTDGGVNGIFNGNIYGSSALTATPLLPFQAGLTASITAITNANPMVITINSTTNPFSNGNVLNVTGVVGAIAVNVNNKSFTVTATGGSSGAYTLTFGATNSTSYGAYGSSGTIGLPITGVSGGVCILNPYTILYGSSGYWAWSDPALPLNFITSQAGNTNVTAQKILRGIPLRGGGGFSPAGLFWSVDSLIRATFVGPPNFWQWDHLTTETSLLSANCVVEVDGSFYWAGADGRFYVYNGIVRELHNNLNLNWFYDNLNATNAAKAFGFRNPRWGEIWWCYPHGAGQAEPNRAVIYNYRENTWYDTGLLGIGRSAGILGDGPLGIIMADADGDSANNYILWQHDIGTDNVGQSVTTPIDAYVETGPITPLEAQVPSANVLSASIFEPDIIQSGAMTITVFGKGTASNAELTGGTYQIAVPPASGTNALVPMKDAFREMRLRFESNAQNGDFQIGDCYLHVHTDGKRLTQ